MNRKSLPQSYQMAEIFTSEESYNKKLSTLISKLSSINTPFFDELIGLTNELLTTSNKIMHCFNETKTIMEKADKGVLSEEDKKKRMDLDLERINLMEEFFEILERYNKYHVRLGKHNLLSILINDKNSENEIRSLLIEPIQRGPRYKLLVNSLIDFAKKNNDEVTDKPRVTDEQRKMLSSLAQEIENQLDQLNENTDVISKQGNQPKGKEFVNRINRARSIQINSKEAYEFIRQELLNYSKANTGNVVFASVTRFFALQWHTHYGNEVAELLLKPTYQTFDSEHPDRLLKDFFIDLDQKLNRKGTDIKSINLDGALSAIIMLTEELTHIDIFQVIDENKKPSSAPSSSH